MPFTEEEKQAWHAGRRQGRGPDREEWAPEPLATCFQCGYPVHHGNARVSAEWSICDACDGD